MEQSEMNIACAVTLSVFVHEIDDKTLYSYVVILPNGDGLKSEFLYGSREEAIRKANGRLYGWLKNLE